MSIQNLDVVTLALAKDGGGGGGGSDSYNPLKDKPQVNGITLIGNKTSQDLGISVTGTYSNGNLTLT